MLERVLYARSFVREPQRLLQRGIGKRVALGQEKPSR